MKSLCRQGGLLCMGSPLQVTLYGEDPEQCTLALKAALAEAERLETLLTPFRPESELTRVNGLAGREWVKPHPDVFSLIQSTLDFARITGGALDPTVEPLMKLWGFRGPVIQNLPDPRRRRETLENVGFEKIQLNPESGSVSFQAPELELSFGATGKGYAADRMAAILRKHQIANAFIHFGSSSYAMGSPPGSKGWRMAIRHPRGINHATQRVTLRDRAISTSGDAEQFVRIGGRRFGHLLDPRTGHPVSGVASATVIATSALEAEAFSTAACVMGAKEGIEFLTHRSVAGLMAREDEKATIVWSQTPGWTQFQDDPRPRIPRRLFLSGLAAMAGCFLLNLPSAHAITYLTPEEAVRNLFPQANNYRQEALTLTPIQKETAQKLLGRRFRDSSFTFWIAEKGNSPMGYAVLLDVIGKEQPITFMVAVGPDEKIAGIEVLIYRESQGYEIRSGGFMRQFLGKTMESSLKLGRDIHAISGATLSSRSTAYAAKKALALIHAVYTNRNN